MGSAVSEAGPLRRLVDGRSSSATLSVSAINSAAYFLVHVLRVLGNFLARRLVADDRLGGEVLLGGERAALDHRIGDLAREQPDRPQRIVIARNHPVHFIRIAIRIDDRDHRNAQPPRLFDRDGFLVRIDHEHDVGQAGHILDAGQVRVQMFPLPLQLDDFLLRARVVAAVGRHQLQLLEAFDGLLNRRHVGQQSTQPALVDVVHLAAFGLFSHRFLRLALGADEQHVFALSRHFPHEPGGVLEHLQGLL